MKFMKILVLSGICVCGCSTQKFAASINRTLGHIEGEVRLDVPDVEWVSEDPDVNVCNDVIRQKVEDTCRNWHKQITTALELLQAKTLQVSLGMYPVSAGYPATSGQIFGHFSLPDFGCGS